MKSNNFTKGDILEATHRNLTKGYHYIIYLEGHSDLDFCGCMITHSNSHDNVPLEARHFETNDSQGCDFKVLYDNSFLVPRKFLKSEEWGPFEKVGALTHYGMAFLDKVIEHTETETFSQYYRRLKFSS